MQTALSKNTVATKKVIHKKKELNLSLNDRSIVQTLDQLKKDLDALHNNFDYVTDPILVDSYAYEILSVHMKYKFYLNLCKERGLVAN